MTADPASENHRTEVWALGPLPPPVTGMTVVTDKVVQRLKERTPLTIASWSASDDKPTPFTRIRRLLLAGGCLAKLILHGRVKDGRLYLCCNSREGLLMTGLFVRVAGGLGYKVFLHHHPYMYIDEFDAKMARIDKNMSAGHVHLMHCPQMIVDFRARYSSKAQCEYLFPSFASLPLGQPRRHVPKPFRLGFLANLTLAKGLDLVLETFRLLRQRNRNVQLCLAGPCASADAKRLVADALNEFGDCISHIGPVFDERKIEFFNSIDAFLFPSRTEGWPIVLNESLDAGVPVVATNRGCVRTMVGDLAGLVVDNAEQYVADAVRQVEAWIASPQTYLAASEAAIRQANFLRRESAIQLEKVISSICSPAESKPFQPSSVTG